MLPPIFKWMRSISTNARKQVWSKPLSFLLTKSEYEPYDESLLKTANDLLETMNQSLLSFTSTRRQVLAEIKSTAESTSQKQIEHQKEVLNTLKDVVQVNGSIDEFMDENGASKEVKEMITFCRQQVDLHGWDGKLIKLLIRLISC